MSYDAPIDGMQHGFSFIHRGPSYERRPALPSISSGIPRGRGWVVQHFHIVQVVA
jgi:hypothetical protein